VSLIFHIGFSFSDGMCFYLLKQRRLPHAPRLAK
jgi:hypothetical protein